MALSQRGALLVAVPYLDIVKMHRFDAKIILASLAGAFAIVRALFLVKPPAFHSPGPELRETEQPELFALIREVAGQMKTPMPVHVYSGARSEFCSARRSRSAGGSGRRPRERP